MRWASGQARGRPPGWKESGWAKETLEERKEKNPRGLEVALTRNPHLKSGPCVSSQQILVPSQDMSVKCPLGIR